MLDLDETWTMNLKSGEAAAGANLTWRRACRGRSALGSFLNIGEVEGFDDTVSISVSFCSTLNLYHPRPIDNAVLDLRRHWFHAARSTRIGREARGAPASQTERGAD